MSLVLFIDMDSFYASCELLRHPELSSKAFVVGTSDEQNKFKGVVETANYLAKKAGIRSAMPTMMAFKIKKDLIYVPSDHEYYDKISGQVMELLRSYGYKMEALSIDEAALDLGTITYIEAEKLGRRIKTEINKKLGLPCTIGISSGKIFAKMVCDDAKPDGLKVVKPEDIREFLKNKGVEKILGVGRKTAERLEAIGIKTIDDIAESDPVTLSKALGSFGRELYALANGIDDSKIVEQWQVLSISRERTLDAGKRDLKHAKEMLDELSEEVYAETIKNGFTFKTVTVKARYSDFTERIKGKSFANYTDSLELMKKAMNELIEDLVTDRQFRKVGVRLSSFSAGKGQKKLF